MKIGSYGSFDIYRTGLPRREGGDGVEWRCTCPRGEPKTDGYPCKHLRSLFSAAREGLVSSHVVLTPDGQRAARECNCIQAAHAAGRAKAPPNAPPPQETPRGEVAGKAPCPCGSGKKYKRCHGLPDAPPLEKPQKPKRTAKKPQSGPRCVQCPNHHRQSAHREGIGGCKVVGCGCPGFLEAAPPPPAPTELRKRQRIAEKRERRAAITARVSAILDRIHAAEDIRRAKRAAKRAKGKTT